MDEKFQHISPEDRQYIDQLVSDTGQSRDALIPLLQGIQAKYRYLPHSLLYYLCSITDIKPSAVSGVSTFYTQFRHQVAGNHTVKICVGTACHVKGAEQVYNSLHRHLGCGEHEDTDADRLFTLEKVACLGCCTLAPVVQIDSVTYGHVDSHSAPLILQDFLSRPADLQKAPAKSCDLGTAQGEIRVGQGSCCKAAGSTEVQTAAEKAVADLAVPVAIKEVACMGMCHQEPILEVIVPGKEPRLYARVDPCEVPRIVRKHFAPRGLTGAFFTWVKGTAENLLTAESDTSVIQRYEMNPREKQVASYLDRQKHIASEYSGSLDPLNLEEYRASGGFTALETCVHRNTPEQIIDTIQEAGLRGRGGAGFPTAVKWDLVRKNNTGTAFIVCNGDEGDPGAFMDRMLLESYPFRILEGMTIAARAVGAAEGVLYIRNEYPLALERIESAITRCESAGLLGDDIFQSGFSFHVRIQVGAGAFVCGEETALLQSIEGYRGMPRFRPPYPAQKGLWDKPTLVNNCETYACVPWILRNGAAAFAAIGTKNSAGTKVFSLAGKINHGGLIEVPMGMTIREIVYDIGGGIPDDKECKAVQIGGPSGGCIPWAMADIPVDFHALTDAGAMMGSGGMVVLDEDDCMVDIARYFLAFTQSQSCGRCTFCRVGTRRMLDILERLCAGEGRSTDLDNLEELAQRVTAASLCGLGKTAPNPVLTTLRYFRDEYEAHIAGHCPSGVCKPLIAYVITDECIGCTLCAQSCPVEAITFSPYENHRIDQSACIQCGGCRAVCPVGAVTIEKK